MYTLILEHQFYCSHQLKLRKGKEPLHSHKWRLQLYLIPIEKSKTIDSNAFILVKNYVQDIISPFEGKSINSHSYFETTNPSTENISHFIFNSLEDLSLALGFKPIKVSLWETEDSCASWIGD